MSDQIAVRQHVPPAGWRPKLRALFSHRAQVEIIRDGG
jgi:hypothetical protein